MGGVDRESEARKEGDGVKKWKGGRTDWLVEPFLFSKLDFF